MEKIKKENHLEKDLLFQQDNASCHKSRESMEAIEVIFGKNKIWWPANSPDLSPIETVWAILKQELSKKKNSNLGELRNNILDIWTRFPKELCSKIISEFDEKVRLCQKEKGKILNGVLIKKYVKTNKDNCKNYDWQTLKMEKKIRIVYNNKIIELIKKKCLKSIKNIQGSKIKEFKKDYPTKKLNKFVTQQEYTKQRELKLKNINYFYDKLNNTIKKITPIDFINNYLNQNLLDRKNLINTNFSKNIQLNEDILKKLITGIVGEQKFELIDEEIEYKINSKLENFKVNEIKKYLPFEMKIEYFPMQQNVPESLKKKHLIGKKISEEENNESIESEETKYSIEDSCNLISQLDEKIKKFRKENMPAKEKEKRIKIKEEINEELGEESKEESEESRESEEYED